MPQDNKGLVPGTKFYSSFPFAGMNVHDSAVAIDDTEFTLIENYLILGKGNLRTAYDVGASLYTAPTGKTIVMFYFYTIGASYYAVVFLSDGSAVQVNATSAVTTTIGPPGTFYDSGNGRLPAASQWGTQYLLISNKNTTNDYWAWDGAQLYAAGSAAPDGVVILSNGIDYTSLPTVSVYGGSGTGMVLTPTIDNGGVVQLAITNPGTGYEVGDHPQVQFTGGGSDNSAVLEATLANGTIAAVNITAPGSGYTSAPTVGFTGGGGSGATASATVGGGVSSVTVTAHGAGYSTATVSFSGGGGTGATADATLTGGVTAVNVTANGTGYTTAPTITFFGGGGTGATATATVAAGAVTAITVTNPGSGYTSAPSVLIGGPGTGATATAAAGGVVSAITVTNPGSGYTSAPTVAVSGDGSGATATASITASGVVSVTITNPGSGYTSAPTVTFTGGGGTGASATALVSSVGVSGVTVVNGGSGFVYAPTVTFVGGGGTNAAAKVLLTGTSIAKVNVTSGGQNYALTPTVKILNGDTGGSGANLRAVISGGQVIAINVLDGGSGYTDAPELLIVPDNLGKSNQDTGTGATATAIMAPTSIGSVVMTAYGSGYTSAPAVEITPGANNAAYAVVNLMPFGISGDAMETFQQRVWILNQTPESWVVNPPTGTFAVSAPESFTDFSTTDGGVLFTNSDRFLQTRYTNVRQSNGYLYMLGDGSVSVISSVSTSSTGTTTFNYQNVDPQTGESWRDSLQDFGRSILFANETGVYGLYGGSVNKISGKLDQLFTDAVFPAAGGLVPTAAVATLFNIKHFMLLMTITDPDTGAPVNKMLTWNEKDWVLTSQTVALKYVGSQKVSSKLYAWGTDGAKLYPLFSQASPQLVKRLDTKAYGAPTSFMLKQMDSLYVVAQDNAGAGIAMTVDYVVSGLTVQKDGFEQVQQGIAAVETSHSPTFSAATSVSPFWPLYGALQGDFPFSHVSAKLTTTSPDFTISNLVISYQDLMANR